MKYIREERPLSIEPAQRTLEEAGVGKKGEERAGRGKGGSKGDSSNGANRTGAERRRGGYEGLFED